MTAAHFTPAPTLVWRPGVVVGLFFLALIISEIFAGSMALIGAVYSPTGFGIMVWIIIAWWTAILLPLILFSIFVGIYIWRCKQARSLVNVS